MSRPTPRKANRHERHSSNLIAAVSDYESDAAVASASASASAAAASSTQRHDPPPPRTNTELNMSVLQRYVPSIASILSIAANAVVYTFDSAAESWDKSGVEGTLFVCTRRPPSPPPSAHDLAQTTTTTTTTTTTPRACVFVLNRRGLGNVIVDLAHVSDVEHAGELVILRVENADSDADANADGHANPNSSSAPDNAGERVLGIWIHNDREETRKVNGAMIQRCWEVVRPAAGAVSVSASEVQRHDAGPAMQAVGRPLTLDELFASQGAASQGLQGL